MTDSGSGPQPSGAINVVRQWEEPTLTVPERGDVLPWSLGLEKLDEGHLYWHVSQGSGGPQVRPVFAVVCDGVLCSTSSASARKTERLLADPRCTLATSVDDVDLVYEGRAARVVDVGQIGRVAEAYRAKYGWPVEATDEGFHAPFGAPAAGPPPYVVFAIEPVTVRAFGTTDLYATRSTRWDFSS